MTAKEQNPEGYLTILLHAHLPYVLNHGTWPHGIEWLHELVVETYLPLLRVLENLSRDRVPANFVISFSPILLEQISHPHFIAEFPKYLERKIVAAREDEAFFFQAGDVELTGLAHHWGRFFSGALQDFRALNGDIVGAFRRFSEAGTIEVITSGATHGYIPLLGTDESIRAQIRTGVDAHIRHFGVPPKGIWLPECGYRPGGRWRSSIKPEGSVEAIEFQRRGVEDILADSGLQYFFVDPHLLGETGCGGPRNLYQTYCISGEDRKPISIFPRDPVTGIQVWSAEIGYPGEFAYLDFHKKRFPGGHRYWKVTGAEVDIDQKQIYLPRPAEEKIQEHAAHFVSLVHETLKPSFGNRTKPVLCAPFDAELFGHWWYEGPMWLETVCRRLHQRETTVVSITSGEYAARNPCTDLVQLGEGSWGAGGQHKVWMNPETAWTYSYIYAAELYVRRVVSEGRWKGAAVGQRIVKQLCRELLLMESSDWQSLMTTGAARDYGEARFLTHRDQFTEIRCMWEALESNRELDDAMLKRLTELERRDSIFPDIAPDYWAVAPQDRDRLDVEITRNLPIV